MLIEHRGFSLITSLTITYFHTGCSTIIGAKSFHGPVRDGKGWYRLAMVIRHDGLLRRIWGAPQPIWKKRKEGGLCCFWHNTDLNLCVLFTPLG